MTTPLPMACAYFAGLTIGVLVPGYGSATGTGSLLALGVGSLVAVCALRTAPGALIRAAPWALSLASLLLGVVQAPRDLAPPLPLPGSARLRAQVEEVRYAQDGHATSRLRVVQGERLDDGALWPADVPLLAGPFPLPEGAEVSVLATVRPAVPFRNPSPHPQLLAAHPTRGFARMASPEAVRVLSHPWPARWLANLRAFVRTRLVATLDPDVEPVARAILLGDPDALDEADADVVRTSGLSHVFAVSGMHVTLLAGLTVWLITRGLLRWRWLSERYEAPRVAAGLGVPLALAIAALTGGAPSGWRASITTAVAWTATACGRRPNAIAVSAAACLLFGVLTPADALRPAFVLSVAATAALIGQPGNASLDALGSLAALVKLNLRTTLATAPVVWWSFGSLPVIGLLANLLLVPVGSLLLLLACAHALTACLAPVLAHVSGAVLAVAARAFLRGAAVCSGLGPNLRLPVLTLAQAAALSCAVVAVLFVSKIHAQRQLLLGATLAYFADEWRVRHAEQPTHALRVTFVDVGQGDAALVDLPDGRLMLIDAGGNPQGGPDPGSRALLPLLAARRRSRIDVAVLTHPHPDHYGGLGALVDALPIGELWDSGQSTQEADFVGTSRAAHELIERARARGTRIVRPDTLCNQPRQLGDASVRVLSPCPNFDPGHDPNDNSLVLRVDYAGRSLLFAGDIEGHAEQRLVAQGAALRADVLKVPHHGSRTSSSERLLHAVRPQLAVISAGAWNPFGHPHPEVRARLRRHVRRVVELAEHGGAILSISAAGEVAFSHGPGSGDETPLTATPITAKSAL